MARQLGALQLGALKMGAIVSRLPGGVQGNNSPGMTGSQP